MRHTNLITPDIYEFAAMVDVLAPNREQAARDALLASQDDGLEAVLAATRAAARRLWSSGYTTDILVKLGAHGVCYSARLGSELISGARPRADDVDLVHVAAVPRDDIVDVSGAGDSLVGAVACGLSQRIDPVAAINAGVQAAALTLGTASSVSERITPALLHRRRAA
jgi:pseudouridine kinase